MATAFRRAATPTAVLLVTLAGCGGQASDSATLTRAETVTPPAQHVRLGLRTSFPITDGRTDGVTCVSYAFGVDGSATLAFAMGADVAFSYERADLVPGGSIPIQITYTPTNDPGPELTVHAVGDVTMSVDVDGACIAGFAIACGLTLDPFACALVALGASLDTFSGELDSFDLISASGDFAAPLGSDPAIVVPGTGDTAALTFLGSTLATAQPVSTFTLSPTPTGAFPGLGGAVALLTATGATLTSPSPLIPVLEWQAPTALTATIQLPATPGASAILTMSPMVHWLGTSASLTLPIDLTGVLGDLFSDPAPISIFSGNLGSNLEIDTLVCSSVPPPAQPACLTTVGAGNIPYPALEPQPPDRLPTVPPLPDFASVQLVITLDADGDGLLDGEEIALGTNPDDADTDDDALEDGAEVANGCDPFVGDTDGDTLGDFQEVTVFGTDCAKRDTDDDALDDNLELTYGTDPLDPDSDGDGIPDGDDVEWLENAISDLPASAFKDSGKAPGLRQALLSRLRAVERRVASGDIAQAIREVQSLLKRLDGCSSPAGIAGADDWIVSCPAQLQVRSLFDLYLSNLSS